jgi:hypothetical protein
MTVGAVRLPSSTELLADPDGRTGSFARLQRGTSLALLKKFNASPVANGQFVDFTFTGAGSQQVMHRLSLSAGNTPSGWKIVDINAAVTVYRSAWDRDSLTLVASGACSLRVWVFA